MDQELLGSTDPAVQEARSEILRILDAFEASEIETDWTELLDLFDAAHLVIESTWYLKLGGYRQCAVCRKKEGKMVDVKRGSGVVCARHADWRVVVLYDQASWAEIIRDELLWTPPAKTALSTPKVRRWFGKSGRQQRNGAES